MITINIFKTIYNDTIYYIKDLKNIINEFITNIYNFLNGYMSKEAIGIFLIAGIALLIIFIFRKVSDK